MDRSGFRRLLADIAAGAARSLRSPAPRRLDFACVQVTTTADSPARPRIGPLCNGCSPTSWRVAHPR